MEYLKRNKKSLEKTVLSTIRVMDVGMIVQNVTHLFVMLVTQEAVCALRVEKIPLKNH